jgi:hypothetical protein
MSEIKTRHMPPSSFFDGCLLLTANTVRSKDDHIRNSSRPPVGEPMLHDVHIRLQPSPVPKLIPNMHSAYPCLTREWDEGNPKGALLPRCETLNIPLTLSWTPRFSRHSYQDHLLTPPSPLSHLTYVPWPYQDPYPQPPKFPPPLSDSHTNYRTPFSLVK